MLGRGGGRSSALDRAKAHLSGQRISALSKDKRNVGNNGTVVPQSKQAKFLDLSDVSSTSQSKNGDDSAQKPSEKFSLGGGSRFLKKTSRDAAGDGPDKFELIPQRNSHSVALSKLSLIENRIRNQKGKGEGLGIQTEPQETRLSLQSSSDLSMTGSRFLKKNKTLSEPQEPLKTPHKTPLESITAVSGVNERKGWRFSPDSDEQDIQRLLGDSFSLSEDIMRKPASPEPFHRTRIKTSIRPSPTSKHPPSSPKPPPSSRPDSRRLMYTECSMSYESDHSEIKSLDDLFPVAATLDSDDTVRERSAASDDFKLLVMSLDDLAPVLSEVAEISHDKVETKLKNEGVSKSTNKIIKVPSPPTPEELSAAYESDFESEIPSEEPASVSEVSEHLTDENKDVSEAQSSYKSQDEDDKLTSLSESSRSSRHRRHSDSSSQSSSSDATVTRGPSPERQMKDTAVQTQTDGLTYTWSSGMAALGPSLGMTYVDPTPIASHTVSAEAIESVTSYSPAMLALNDMLRQQLALTRAFIDTTRRHYTSVMEALGTGDYKYTTLEDTKEFIRTHRPPKLSMEEALEEVLQEMKDYHYI